jgi:hypothetical protein
MKLNSEYTYAGCDGAGQPCWEFDGCFLNGSSVDVAPFMLNYLDTGRLLLDSGEVPAVASLFDEDSGEPLAPMTYMGLDVTELVAEMLDSSKTYIEVMIYES